MRRGLWLVGLLCLTGCSKHPEPRAEERPAAKLPVGMAGVWTAPGSTLYFSSDAKFMIVLSSESSGYAGFGTLRTEGERLYFKFDPALNVVPEESPATFEYDSEKDRLSFKAVAMSISAPVANSTYARAGLAAEADKKLADLMASLAKTGVVREPKVTATPTDKEQKLNQDRTVCASNLRQIGTAALIYAGDYDGSGPDASAWQDSLRPYTKTVEVYTCPTLKDSGETGGYAYNLDLSRIVLSKLTDPATTPMVFESATRSPNAHDLPTMSLTAPRHKEVLAVYADGHVGKR